MNRHFLFLAVVLGLILISGFVAVIRPLRAAGPSQAGGIYLTPRMVDSLQR